MNNRSPPMAMIRRSARAAGATLPLSLLAGCSGVLDPAGPVGANDAAILIDATLIMLAVIVPTIALAFWTAWKYRASNRTAEYLPYWSYSGRVEAVVWSIPILVIMFLGGVILIGSYRLDPFRALPAKTPPIDVQVVALDWKWLFIYPKQQIATVNDLVLPAGAPVRFSITAANVFNVFFIPRLGSMIYAMPGMVAQLNLQADRPIRTWGASAQFSGDGFSDMTFEVKSLQRPDFEAWATALRSKGEKLDAAAYAALLKQSQKAAPASYGDIDPNLFMQVATQKIGPGPGAEPPTPAHAGREVSTGGSQ